MRLIVETKMPPGGGIFVSGVARLLDLGFLEFNVFACDRVVLAERHLLRLGTAVLARNVEETGVSGRQKLDLDIRSLSHFQFTCSDY
jgi:hypothetical protein